MKLAIRRLYALRDRSQILVHVDAERWDELGPFGPIRLTIGDHALALSYSGRLSVCGPAIEPVIVVEPLPRSRLTLDSIVRLLGEPDQDGFFHPVGAYLEVGEAGRAKPQAERHSPSTSPPARVSS